jgi:cytochrome c oxidase subunit 2
MSDPIGPTADSPWVALAPGQASDLAPRLDALFLWEVAIIGLVVGTLLVLMVVFSIRYRHSRTGPRKPLPRGRKARWMEVGWSLGTLAVFMVFFAWGALLYIDMGEAPDDALEIQGVAKQWMWKFQHPDGQREIDELHVPVGQAVRVTLISQDVIHSFYVPAFRVKQDVLPGRYTHVWFRPTRTGRYHLLCAEYCGTRHSHMRGTVIVMEPQAYAEWLDRRRPGEDLAEAGARLFRSLGCSGCHAERSSVHAPSLVGIWGRRAQLAEGGTAEVDSAYVRDSILLPQKHVVAGYEPIMPSYEGQLDEAELFRLVAYVQSLADTEPTP